MITYIQNGNIFDSKMQTLVNPVNCVGVMGKGLALEFKKRYPKVNNSYMKECRAGRFKGFEVFSSDDGTKLIACLATKIHWRDKSTYELTKKGLIKLYDKIQDGLITSLAIPAIGCGLGGLSWNKVKGQIETHLGSVATSIEVYEPKE